MRRRAFISLLGVAAWPLAARAPQPWLAAISVTSATSSWRDICLLQQPTQ